MQRDRTMAAAREELVRGGLHDVANLLTVAWTARQSGADSDGWRYVELAARVCRRTLDANPGPPAVTTGCAVAPTLASAAELMNAGQGHERAAVRLELAAEGRSAQAAIDELDLLRLMINLCENATRAAGAQGRVIVRAELAADAEAPEIRLEVRDDGPGLPAELLEGGPRAGLCRATGGHGFGLVTCERLVAGAGGRLEFGRCAELGGACVSVSLPLVDSEAPAVEEATDILPMPSRRLRGRVLVADDDPSVAAITARLLQSAGAQVLCAQDAFTAIDALALLEEGDTLLLDATLEGGAAAVLAARPVGVRIVLTSGLPEQDVRQRLGTAAEAFLAKPFDRELLIAAVAPSSRGAGTAAAS